jgi:hypothetical protein
VGGGLLLPNFVNRKVSRKWGELLLFPLLFQGVFTTTTASTASTSSISKIPARSKDWFLQGHLPARRYHL